jgi:mRNA deadenylase 3'-5' endonuclease subunit Ccr4
MYNQSITNPTNSFYSCSSRINRYSSEQKGFSFTQHLYKRDWIKLHDDSMSHQNDDQDTIAHRFSLLSYNLLCSVYIEPNYFPYHPAPILDHSNRRTLAYQNLVNLNNDILCLQEVLESDYKQYYSVHLAQHNYSSLFSRRTCVRDVKLDGCAIFYNNRLFELVDEKTINYIDYPSNDSKDNIAQLALLQFHENQKELLCIINTHILYNPNRGDIKLGQLQLLFSGLNEFLRSYTDDKSNSIHIILAGDFNATPQSQLIHYIVRGYLDCSEANRYNLDGTSSHNHISRIKQELKLLQTLHNPVLHNIDKMKRNNSAAPAPLAENERLNKVLPMNELDYQYLTSLSTTSRVHHDYHFHPCYVDRTMSLRPEFFHLYNSSYPYNYRPSSYHYRYKGQVDHIFYTPNNINHLSEQNTKNTKNNNNDSKNKNYSPATASSTLECSELYEFPSLDFLASSIISCNHAQRPNARNKNNNIRILDYGLPTLHEASDHFLLAAKFSLRRKPS